jgi:hypothetical protein
MKLQEALLLIGPHSQAAIRQVTPPASRLDAEVSSPAEALQHAFLWRESIEGYDFWARLHRQLESGTLIPEPVAVTPEPVAVTPEPVVPTAPEPEPEPEPIYGIPHGAPEPPPAPVGHRWVYRGTGWESTDTTHCFLDVSGSWSRVYVNGNTNGLRHYHYLEAVPVLTASEPVPVPTASEPEPEPELVPPPLWPSNMPPLPEVPAGFDRWEYRGTRWTARGVVYACWFDYEDSWRSNPYPNNAGGNASCHYAEAVKTLAAPEPEPEPERLASSSLSAPVPRNLLPLPELPEGFSQWVYRGTGWSSRGEVVHFQCRHVVDEDWGDLPVYHNYASGVPYIRYIEAIREPLQCEVGRCYVQRDGVIRGELILTSETTSGADNHPFFDGVFYRTPEGRLFTYDTFGSTVYIAEVEPQ